MTVAQRCESEGIVVPHVFHVPDAHQGGFQQAHDGGQYFRSRQTGKSKVGSHAAANLGQRASKGGQVLVLGLIADSTPAWVIAILLASASVARRDLEVAALK